MNAAAILAPKSDLSFHDMTGLTFLLSTAIALVQGAAGFDAASFAEKAQAANDSPVVIAEAPANANTISASAPLAMQETGAAAASEAPAAEAEAEGEPLRTRAEEIARLKAYFESVDTLRARFIQNAGISEITEGELLLDRPGRVRFDYDDPSPILLVADGSTVAIADFDLETIDRAPIRSTPLRFLLSGTDQLAEAVTEAGRSQNKLYVTVVDPDGEVDGRLTLVFADPDPSASASEMTLAGWFAVDAMGGLTEVNLSEMERGVSFDPRLFILDDEDVIADDRRSRRR